MNERVKKLRKDLELSQENFANRLGVTKATISRIEKGVNNLTEQMIKSICREFSINETWLRYGTGEKEIEPNEFSLDKYVKSKGVTDFELSLIKSYFEMPEDLRKEFMNVFKKSLINNLNNETTNTKEETFEDRKKKELEAYAFELDAEQKGQISSVSEKPKGA